ncbi:hypothetical protein BHE74_00003190 [Ensete ventricosum]|nr:hypothetical protein BHE74_00003190 [Ensete ventricosum]
MAWLGIRSKKLQRRIRLLCLKFALGLVLVSTLSSITRALPKECPSSDGPAARISLARIAKRRAAAIIGGLHTTHVRLACSDIKRAEVIGDVHHQTMRMQNTSVSTRVKELIETLLRRHFLAFLSGLAEVFSASFCPWLRITHRPPRTRSSVGKFWIVEVAMGEKEKGEAVEVNPVTGSPFSRRYHKLLERRMKLPVWGQRSKFLDALAKRQVVVVAAPPGSGKSTQIPQFVIEAGYASKGKQIACTQPRRLVATALSRRVAQEMDVKLGEEVGYSVLFEDCTDRQTILK